MVGEAIELKSHIDRGCCAVCNVLYYSYDLVLQAQGLETVL